MYIASILLLWLSSGLVGWYGAKYKMPFLLIMIISTLNGISWFLLAILLNK